MCEIEGEAYGPVSKQQAGGTDGVHVEASVRRVDALGMPLRGGVDEPHYVPGVGCPMWGATRTTRMLLSAETAPQTL